MACWINPHPLPLGPVSSPTTGRLVPSYMSHVTPPPPGPGLPRKTMDLPGVPIPQRLLGYPNLCMRPKSDRPQGEMGPDIWGGGGGTRAWA